MIRQKDYSWIFESRDPADPSDPAVMGHVRLTPSISIQNDVEGSAPCGILTSVVVDVSMRGKGIGQLMMQEIEKTALKKGYCQLYLWTYDAVDFYRKLGYCISEERRAFSTMASALDCVDRAALNSLERLLTRKLEVVQNAVTVEEFTAPDSNRNSKATPIWMRKRIRDEVPLERVPVAHILASIKRTLHNTTIAASPLLANSADCYCADVFLHACEVVSKHEGADSVRHSVQHHRLNVAGEKNPLSSACAMVCEHCVPELAQSYLPWSHQIGPSCGIQALRFAEHLMYASSPLPLSCSAVEASEDFADWNNGTNNKENGKFKGSSDPPHSLQKTLLRLAIDAEYTSDGEMYNINHMCALAQMLPGRAVDRSEVDAYVVSADQLSCADLCNLLLGSCSRSNIPLRTGAHEDDYSATTNNSSERVKSRGFPAVLILPYDRDDTQSTPCCKEGVAAHYALICGFVLLPGALLCGHEIVLEATTFRDSSCVYSAKQQDGVVPVVSHTVDPARVLLVGMHGLSSKPIVAPYADWVVSNAQLHCTSARLSKGTETASLKGSFVVLK